MKAVRSLRNRPDLSAAAYMFSAACAASRAHSALAGYALKAYGSTGPQISGCVRDHFPEQIKNALRLLAAEVTARSDAAYNARPWGVRSTTMRALSREVAAAVGSGFYGPQP